MRGNDLSNEVVPRFVLVFEHLIGLVPNNLARVGYESYIRTRRWKRAVNTLVVNEPLARHMWHVTWHLHHTLDVVTYLDPNAVEPVTEWLNRADLPVHRAWYSDPYKLGRKIATMPDVAAIFDPDPGHQLVFGKRGRLISPGDPDLLRAWGERWT